MKHPEVGSGTLADNGGSLSNLSLLMSRACTQSEPCLQAPAFDAGVHDVIIWRHTYASLWVMPTAYHLYHRHCTEFERIPQGPLAQDQGFLVYA